MGLFSDLKGVTVWLDISTFCNAACPQCHRTDPNGLDKMDWLPLKKWDLEEFVNAFPAGSMDRIGKFWLCGSWGDPLMSKDLLEMCKHIIDHSNATIHINTNGGLRSPSWWEKLGSYCGDRLLIYFDIDGINNEMHAKYRRGVELDKVLENMEAISNTPANVKAFIILFKHNENYTYDMMNLAKMYGANECYVIKSDRFLVNNKFRFVNEDGEEEFLEEMTRKDLSRHIKNSEWVDRAEEFVQSQQDKPKGQMGELPNEYVR